MEDKKPEPPQWEYRKNLKITERMKDVIGLTIDATKAEVATLRKKLEKLQYGG